MNPNPEHESAYFLVGLSKELLGKRFRIFDGATLGRAVNATVFLPDPTLGRQHARFEVSAAGPRIINCSHEAGIPVNGECRTRHLLRVGDVIALGRFELRLELAQAGPRRGNEVTPHTPLASEVAEQKERLSSGVVLTLRLGGSPQLPDAGSMVPRLWATLAPLARNAGARFLLQDPVCPRIVWHDEGRRDPSLLYAAAKLAQAIHRSSFLAHHGRAEIGIGAGIAAGRFCEMECKSKAAVWGGAAETSLLLAASAAVSTTLVNLKARSEQAVRLIGYQGEGTGRRQKLVVAQRASLIGFGHRVDALLVRVNHDPETQKAMVTLICRAPLEMNEEYRVQSVSGSERVFTSRSFEKLSDLGAIRVQLSGHHPLDSIAHWLGLDGDLNQRLLLQAPHQAARQLAA